MDRVTSACVGADCGVSSVSSIADSVCEVEK